MLAQSADYFFSGSASLICNSRSCFCVTSDGAPGDALEPVRLLTLRNVKGGLPVQMVAAPNAPSDLKETK